MDVERAEGVVLRCQPVTETSLIVTWFTREFGKLKTLAKGARRPKSPFRGKLDLFYLDEFLFLSSRRSDLHLLHECYLEQPHVKLRSSHDRVAAASFVCELVDLATALEDPNRNIFDLLAVTIHALETGDVAILVVWFELHLLEASGWAPKFEGEDGTSRVLRSLQGASLSSVKRVRLSVSQIEQSHMELRRLWEAYSGRFPRSARWLMTEIAS